MILRWLVQRNIVALPKSTHRERMEQNIDVFDFTLSDEEMAAVTALDTKTSLFFRHDTPEARRYVRWFHQGTRGTGMTLTY